MLSENTIPDSWDYFHIYSSSTKTILTYHIDLFRMRKTIICIKPYHLKMLVGHMQPADMHDTARISTRGVWLHPPPPLPTLQHQAK